MRKVQIMDIIQPEIWKFLFSKTKNLNNCTPFCDNLKRVPVVNIVFKLFTGKFMTVSTEKYIWDLVF